MMLTPSKTVSTDLVATTKKQTKGKDCVLEEGIYPITSLLTVNLKKGVIRAADGASVYLDGTKELETKWKPCKNLANFKDRCAKGVMAASITDDIFQLFVTGKEKDDPEKREMLVPARWPNKKPKDGVVAADAPSWVTIFDTKKTWSFVSTADHGLDASSKNGNTNGKGWLVDDGGNSRTMHVEVEDDMWEDVTISGEEYLKDAGIDATGAVAVVAWGKQMSEQALVKSHVGNKLELHQIPCPSENPKIVPYRVPPYTSCSTRPFVKRERGKEDDPDSLEQGMLSYFLTQKLELLDQDGEWHFEPNKNGGGTLFVKMEKHPREYRFRGRVGDLALNFTRSAVEVRDLTFFASRLEAYHSPLKLIQNTFLYSSHSQRSLLDPKDKSGKLPKLYAPESNYMFTVNNAEIRGNIFRYSEGKAIDFIGKQVKFLDNLVEFNGYNGIDGPGTVKIGRQEDNTVSYNTLRWNGQVSGLFNLAPESTFAYNRIERQNFGKLQHDGAGIHVVISGQSSTFQYNWIYNGDHSMMIRTDTAKTTKLSQVGRKGTIQYNVGWGGPALVIKGDEHTISHNTVVGTLQVVVAFGKACGMNAKSSVHYNAAASVAHRGECTNKAGKVFNSLPNDEKGNIGSDNLCDKLKSCNLFDFRPKANSLRKDGGTAGAYTSSAKVYFIPGRRLLKPQSPIPQEAAEVTAPRPSLIFQRAKNCKTHTVYFGWDKTKVDTMKCDKPGCAQKELPANGNVWDITWDLTKHPVYYWRVQPSAKDCVGASVSPLWSFNEVEQCLT